MHGFERETIVETLLNTLEAERYVRGPLLRSVCDELEADDSLGLAAQMARSFVIRFDGGSMGEAEFRSRIRALRACVRRGGCGRPALRFG